MSFSCLVLCDELSSIELVGRLMDELGIQREICTEAPAARKAVQERKFEAILVDCEGIHGGIGFVKELRQIALNRYAIVFALTGGNTRIMQAFEQGANFVLQKPVTTELMARSLRAAQGFMLREQRRAYRHPVDVFLTVRDEQNKQSPRYFSSLNLSEGGIGIEGAREFKPGTPIAIHFEIPETKYAVEGTAKIAWVNPDGHAGIVFNDIPRIARLRLREWLGEKFDKQASSMFPGGEDAGQRTILNLPPSKFEHMVERVMLKHRL